MSIIIKKGAIWILISIHEFRSRAIYEFYLGLQVMSIFGIIFFYRYFFQDELMYSLILIIAYMSFVILKVAQFVYKVYLKGGAEDFQPFIWSVFIDGIFLCFFLYFVRDYFDIFSQLFYIYLVLLSMMFNHRCPMVCSSFIAICYISLVSIQDYRTLTSLAVITHILLFYLLGYIMSTLVIEINKLESRMCYMYDDLEQKNHLLSEMVSKDFLTNLNNHKTFYIYYKDIVLRSCQSKSAFSLAILDIDDFKKINDTYGHLAGDKILQEISSLIQVNIRKTDVAARYGGEEFAILFPDTSAKDSADICERIRNNIESHVLCIDNQSITVTISGGVAGGICTDPYYRQNKLFDYVDQLLYKAKSEGKNRVLYSHELIHITE